MKGMVFAVEPPKGIPGIGLVGTENTYIVTPDGGMSIKGDYPGLMPVF
jgi:Xaa-Pro aminopeptidase